MVSRSAAGTLALGRGSRRRSFQFSQLTPRAETRNIPLTEKRGGTKRKEKKEIIGEEKTPKEGSAAAVQEKTTVGGKKTDRVRGRGRRKRLLLLQSSVLPVRFRHHIAVPPPRSSHSVRIPSLADSE